MKISSQRLLEHIQDHAAGDDAYWLAQASPAWLVSETEPLDADGVRGRISEPSLKHRGSRGTGWPCRAVPADLSHGTAGSRTSEQ